MQLNPYLNFNGNCREAFGFYQDVLGGTDLVVMPYRGTPAEAHMPESQRDQVMHARLTVGGVSLMGSDVPEGRFEAARGISVAIQLTDIGEAERVFAALSEGGTVGMPIAETFWAKRFGYVIDRFGTPWMVNCD